MGAAGPAALLRQSPLFTGLEDEEVSRLLELARVEEFSAGATIVAQGSAGDSLFLLCSGALRVCARGERGRSVTLATLAEPGAFFGEVAIVDPGPRSATVKAEADAVVLVISLEALEQFFEEFKDTRVVVLRNLARVLAQRLRQTNALFGATAS